MILINGIHDQVIYIYIYISLNREPNYNYYVHNFNKLYIHFAAL
jgi:hypothetical protein